MEEIKCAINMRYTYHSVRGERIAGLINMHDVMKPKPALRFFDLSRKQSIPRSFRNSRIYCIEEDLIISSISKMLVVPN